MPPIGAVSPLGLPTGLGKGALIVLSKFQSLVLVTAIVLSSAELKSLPRVGKCRAVMAAEWCSRLPNSRFCGFSTTAFEFRESIAGIVILDGAWADEEDDIQVMALSTDDGRILFYSTRQGDLITAPGVEGKETPLPAAKLIAQLGGKDAGKIDWEKRGKSAWTKEWEAKANSARRKASTDGKEIESEFEKAAQRKAEKQAETAWLAGLSTRVKDFTVLSVSDGVSKDYLIPAASSDGALRIWKLSGKDLEPHTVKVKQVGTLLGMYKTSNRITCMKAFVMLPAMEKLDDEFEGFDEEDVEEADSSSSGSE